MSSETIVALLSLAGTLIGSLSGILVANKLVNYRLSQLEKKVDKHNSVVERTYKLEGRITEIEHDLRDLKGSAKWFKAAGVRALKTIAQTAVATIGTTAVMNEVDWIMVGSASLLAGILSLLTSVAGLPELNDSNSNSEVKG